MGKFWWGKFSGNHTGKVIGEEKLANKLKSMHMPNTFLLKKFWQPFFLPPKFSHIATVVSFSLASCYINKISQYDQFNSMFNFSQLITSCHSIWCCSTVNFKLHSLVWSHDPPSVPVMVVCLLSCCHGNHFLLDLSTSASYNVVITWPSYCIMWSVWVTIIFSFHTKLQLKTEHRAHPELDYFDKHQKLPPIKIYSRHLTLKWRY